MIEAHELSKSFGVKAAVDDVSFTIRPGTVTGFLGPNGAGKSTVMKLILGLERPSSGSVTVSGSAYRSLAAPMREVGALLDAGWLHPRRPARAHLRSLAVTHGYGKRRVEEVLELTGIASAAASPIGKFSLGMRQRLGIAAALLGDPRTLILDEPVNGLDPDGVIWIRTFLRELAAEGRTVLLSSHLMSEMEQTADRIIVMGRGRVIADGSLHDIVADTAGASVLVRSPQVGALVEMLTGRGAHVSDGGDGAVRVTGTPIDAVGALAAHAGIELHELRTIERSLEDAYRRLVIDSVEHQAGDRMAART
ncbi:ATP-binding cassette domain-containing protein [Plantibacter sp. YIM 135347]|uniref:ATP-binding cassette domain-containing protein n=1 Tax=Plantibacter sp. YIM 135347 TaxID=3423919 RepID=UPI003D326AAC